MKKVLLFCFICCLSLLANSQKVHFVYLQSEGGSPFYVKMGEKVFSSTAEGYLILSSMKDSTYSFLLGQTGKNKEVQFSITINKVDKGYLIKTVDNNPVLFDLQTLSLTKPIVLTQSSAGTVAKTDLFTKLLAKAADDSTLLYQVAFAEPEKKQVKENVAVEQKQPEPKKEDVVVVTPPPAENTATAVAKVDTLISTTQESTAPAQNTVAITKPAEPEPTKTEEPAKLEPEKTQVAEPSKEVEYKKSVVEKKSESSTSEGFGLVFLDTDGSVTDTIKIVIPNPKVVFRDTTNEAIVEKKAFLDIPSSSTDSSVDKQKDVVSQAPAVDPRKASCNSVSTDDDFFKLRRDMAAEKTDEGMIAQANRHFKSKCFKTEQIKYLSALFLTEQSKYQFFDTAFMHVADQERYELLQGELKDPYYVNRFRALIAK